jgi:hypothetical protein
MLLREFQNLCRLDLVTHHCDELRLVTGGLSASQNRARLRVLGNSSKQTLFFFGLQDDLNLHKQAIVSGTKRRISAADAYFFFGLREEILVIFVVFATRVGGEEIPFDESSAIAKYQWRRSSPSGLPSFSQI